MPLSLGSSETLDLPQPPGPRLYGRGRAPVYYHGRCQEARHRGHHRQLGRGDRCTGCRRTVESRTDSAMKDKEILRRPYDQPGSHSHHWSYQHRAPPGNSLLERSMVQAISWGSPEARDRTWLPLRLGCSLAAIYSTRCSGTSTAVWDHMKNWRSHPTLAPCSLNSGDNVLSYQQIYRIIACSG